jgi:hypothetical protein
LETNFAIIYVFFLNNPLQFLINIGAQSPRSFELFLGLTQFALQSQYLRQTQVSHGRCFSKTKPGGSMILIITVMRWAYSCFLDAD